MWVKIEPRRTAGFGPCCHLPVPFWCYPIFDPQPHSADANIPPCEEHPLTALLSLELRGDTLILLVGVRRVPAKKSGCGSKPMGSHFGVGELFILEPILVGIGMFTGGTGFSPMATPREYHSSFVFSGWY